MQAAHGRWHRTPPAIFPPILGLFGLGLGWRLGRQVFGLPVVIGEAILAAASVLLLSGLVAYLSKLIRRPGALSDDLGQLPGQAGVSAASMAIMLFAATLVPFWSGLAKSVLAVGLGIHLVVAALVPAVLWRTPSPQWRITPVWHVTFVGMIVAPIAAVPLGWDRLAEVILFGVIVLAGGIWVGNLRAMMAAEMPPPMRLTLVIHLAPAALSGIAASLLGYGTLASFFGLGTVRLAALLLIKMRYLTAAGFNPMWGAITFPVAAFTSQMLIMAQTYGGAFRLLGGAALLGATLAIPPIAYRIIRMWRAGSLAEKTNASAV